MHLQPAKNPSSSTSASILSYPLDAPTLGWFLEAFHYLNVELGPQYLVLLQKWIDYKRKACWLNPHKLAGFSPEKQPSVLLSWMKNRPRPLPKVDKRGFFTPKFAEEVAAWWASLQPQWRSLDKNGLPSPFEEFGDDLSPLDKHGRNAWVALLACIKWWGVGLEYCVADDRGLHLEKWFTIIADMTRMLGKLAAD
ncbi:hypothetical protein F5879DRAFT_806316 [Lentinula edodes]|nr:hypothetical protein F5879DRAFT_806316 [Lentinula edodes]